MVLFCATCETLLVVWGSVMKKSAPISSFLSTEVGALPLSKRRSERHKEYPIAFVVLPKNIHIYVRIVHVPAPLRNTVITSSFSAIFLLWKDIVDYIIIFQMDRVQNKLRKFASRRLRGVRSRFIAWDFWTIRLDGFWRPSERSLSSLGNLVVQNWAPFLETSIV